MKELTILLPCLNEAETIAVCVSRARKLLDEHGIEGEILVSDNGSTDGSQEIAGRLGARVIHCPVRGYGAALQHGIENAEGEFVLMGDADGSYHFDEAMPLVMKLRQGYDVCMGTRLRGRIMPAAMPLLNRYLGNPILTGIGRLLFNITVTDFHSGMRAFRRDKILSLNLVTTGMEWASEMIIKAQLGRLRITEVPITLYKDGRSRSPHLRRWRDGWRHLRFMLLHSPNWLFVVPGLVLAVGGLIGSALLLPGTLPVGSAHFDVQSLLVASFAIIVGMQAVFTGLFANLYAHIVGILPVDERFLRLVRKLSLETVLVVSGIVGLIGLSGLLFSAWKWFAAGFPGLDVRVTMRILVPSLAMIALSVQGIFNGFMLSILFLKTRREGESRLLSIIEREERVSPGAIAEGDK